MSSQSDPNTQPTSPKKKAVYRSVIVLDYMYRREKGETPVMSFSIGILGEAWNAIKNTRLTKSARMENITIPLYNNNNHTYNVIAKVEKAVPAKEEAKIVRTLNEFYDDLLRKGCQVPEIAKRIIHKFRAHVSHGQIYQDRSLPPVKMRRINRDDIFVTETETETDNMKKIMQKSRNKNLKVCNVSQCSSIVDATTKEPPRTPSQRAPERKKSTPQLNRTKFRPFDKFQEPPRSPLPAPQPDSEREEDRLTFKKKAPVSLLQTELSRT